MTEPLRIDTDLVLEAGGRLRALADAIPEPPASFKPAGGDALSTAIAAKVAEVVDPAIAELPVVKAELAKYAQNVVHAANTYDAVDRQIAAEIRKRLELLNDAAGEGPGTAL
ncbi:type VII secretion target [Mycobacterium sp. IS-1590]|uniref:type VII secretion target n=1 Tax=Mycobacterium sp. IS-1590 TaxID=1772286 RepID=UPI000ACDB85C|nr:type VII secretion target [Mycobacterium sp. IS-1590]